MTILIGDTIEQMRTLADASVHCCVTSPPYWGLRDYGTATWEGGDPGCDHIDPCGPINSPSGKSTLTTNAGKGPLPGDKYQADRKAQYRDSCNKCGAIRIDNQIGLEATPELFVAKMVEVFREVRRVLHPSGTCWVNLGDSYFGGGRGGNPDESAFRKQATNAGSLVDPTPIPRGCKPKDLVGIPWLVAFALRADGWWLRQDIIWAKKSPMPESVTDRCCKSHEYVFLLSKSERYFFDHIAIQEDAAGGNEELQQVQAGSGDGLFLSEQPAGRRSNRGVSRLHDGDAQGVGQAVQPDTEGAGGVQTLLSLREGAGGKAGLSQDVHNDRCSAREVSSRGTRSRKRSAIQGSSEAVRSESEGQGNEGSAGQAVRQNGQGEILEAEGRDQEEASDQIRQLHNHAGSMAGDQGGFQESVCVLPPDVSTSGNGSCDPAVEARTTLGGEHRSRVPEVQRIEGQSPVPKRNKRSVWRINSQPFSGAHFATFPEALVEPCIRAGTSEKGCCPECLAPWERVVEREPNPSKPFNTGADLTGGAPNMGGNRQTSAGMHRNGANVAMPTKTLGWQPTCKCDAGEPVPCCVLDPFLGSGTTLLVARKLGRSGIGCELNPTYAAMAERRIGAYAPLFAAGSCA